MSYKEDVSKASGLGGLADFHVVKPSAVHKPYMLNQKGPTVIRIYPQMAEGREVSFRVADGDGEFSDWVHYEPMVRYYGVTAKATAFLRTRGQPLEYKGPLALTQYSLYQLTRHAGVGTYPPAWKDWLKKDERDPKSKGPALPAPDHAGLVQGMLFEHGGKRMVGPDGRTMNPVRPVVLILNKTARQWLEGACNVLNPAVPSGAAEDRYALGDIVQLSKGRLISFIFQPASSTTTAHYTGAALDQCVPLPSALVASEWRPWDEVLDFLDDRQQVDLLCRIFPDEVIDYALGAHQEFSRLLPERVRGAYDRYMGRTSVPASQPVQQAQPAQPLPQAPVYTQPTVIPPASVTTPAVTLPSAATTSPAFTPVVTPASASPGAPAAPQSFGVSAGYDFRLGEKSAPAVAPAAQVATPPEFQTTPSAPPAAAPGQPTGDAATDAAKINQARLQLQEAIKMAGGMLGDMR